MRFVLEWFRRLLGVARQGRADLDLRQELQAHVDLAAEDAVRRRVRVDEALHEARVRAGGAAQAMEALQDQRSVRWIEELRQDVRDVLRGLRTGWRVTALVVAILTLTLAAGTVTFSVVDAVALQSLPFHDHARLVGIVHEPREGRREGTTPQDFFAWRDLAQSFTGLAAATTNDTVTVEAHGRTETLSARGVTSNLFDVLGVRPVLGRLFTAENETAGRADVLLLSHETWTRIFGGDPSVIGRRVNVKLRQSAFSGEVVGVLPPDVRFPINSSRPPDLYRPHVVTAGNRTYGSFSVFYFDVVGRLRPGVSLTQARSEIDRLTESVHEAHRVSSIVDSRIVVLPLHDRVVGYAKSWLLLALAAVVCVVLIGCVNAASLLLARATVRTRELATRAALGASRIRLARTLLLEGLALALTSFFVATVLAQWGVSAVKANLPTNLARVSDIAVDSRVVVASVGAALLCGLIAGGAPAWRVLRADLFGQMRTGTGVIGGRREGRSLGAFLVAEIAFATVLLVATSLAVTSFVIVTTSDLGFERRNVAAISVVRSLQAVPEEQRQAVASVFFGEVADRARAVPGVVNLGLIAGAEPLGGGSTRYSVEIPGFGQLTGLNMFETRAVTSDYFAAMGLRLLRGRTFTIGDRAGAAPVAIINDLAAQRYFSGRDPIGQVIGFRGDTVIVGVVQSVRLNGPEADLWAELYVPLAQEPQTFSSARAQLVIRTAGTVGATAAAVRDALGPDMVDAAMQEPRIVNDEFRRITADRRFNAGLMTIFGVLAVVIAAIGIYGTMSFVVAQQSRAIGLRMALGASKANVFRVILRESLWRVGLGAAIGLAGAWATAGLFSSLVFGVTPTSPTVYASVAGGIACLALGATLLPARRAAQLDPLAALRAE